MKSVVIINDDEGKSIGFVFVKIDLHDNAKMAIESLNGADIGKSQYHFLDYIFRILHIEFLFACYYLDQSTLFWYLL